MIKLTSFQVVIWAFYLSIWFITTILIEFLNEITAIKYAKHEITMILIIKTKCITKEDINHSHHNAHNIESRYFIHMIAQLAAVIGFNKKLHTHLGQKVNYLNALSDPFDKVSRERDLLPPSYYGAETNADARGEKHSLVWKIFRFRVAHCRPGCKNVFKRFTLSYFVKFCIWSNYP